MKISVQMAGVFRCCLETIGATKDSNGLWRVREAREGERDKCKACGREFLAKDIPGGIDWVPIADSDIHDLLTAEVEKEIEE